MCVYARFARGGSIPVHIHRLNTASTVVLYLNLNCRFIYFFSAVSDTVSVGEPDLAADLAGEPVKVAAAPLDLPSPEEVRICCSSVPLM